MGQEIVNQLKKMADPKYLAFQSNLCPGTKNILGIRVPVLRNYAKELMKQYSTEELLSQIGNKYYEEIMLQGMLIGLDTKQDLSIIFNRIKKFVPKIDNWAICDVFCAGLKITKQYPREMWDFLIPYFSSNEEFMLRFGIVMLLDYYLTDSMLDSVLAILDGISHEGYYVKMAVAWAVSIALVKYTETTIHYLKTCHLDDFTYNKSIQKAIESYRIPEEMKEKLRKMKR